MATQKNGNVGTSMLDDVEQEVADSNAAKLRLHTKDGVEEHNAQVARQKRPPSKKDIDDYNAGIARQKRPLSKEDVDAYNFDIMKLKLSQERNEYDMRLAEEQEEQESKTPEPEKMGLLFFIVALFLSAVGDVIDFFTGGTIGWLVGLLIDGILALMFGLSSSGRKQFKKMAVAFVGESIPIIDMLPFRTITTIWSFISSRSKIAQKVSSLAQKTT